MLASPTTVGRDLFVDNYVDHIGGGYEHVGIAQADGGAAM